MVMLIRLTPVLLFALALLTAVIAATKPPPSLGAYPDTWGIFALASVFGALGLGLWHRQRALQRQEPQTQDTVAHEPWTLLEAVVPRAKALQGEWSALSEAEVRQRVEGLLEDYMMPMAEHHERWMDRFGVAHGAEVCVVLAFAERMLNRVWSASADGHVPEATACFPEAVAALEEAATMARTMAS